MIIEDLRSCVNPTGFESAQEFVGRADLKTEIYRKCQKDISTFQPEYRTRIGNKHSSINPVSSIPLYDFLTSRFSRFQAS